MVAAKHPSHANNFDVLRVLAATMVVASHSFSVVGAPEPAAFAALRATTWGGVGVEIFFSISGYLVALSWRADPHVGRYALRRALRLIPGLALVGALTALVLGPFVTSVPLATYFGSAATWLYIPTSPLGLAFPPGLFATNPLSDINAPLWTIFYEALCYAALIALAVAGLFRRATLAPLVLLASLVVNPKISSWASEAHVVYQLAASYGVMFFVGSLLALARDKVRFLPWIAIPLYAAGMALRDTPAGPTLAMLITPYVVLTLALGIRVLPSALLAKWDPSYGMYLFAFPVQQTVRMVTDTSSPWFITLVTLAIIVPLSVVSWILVEEPALRLKPSRPRSATANNREVAEAPAAAG
jgi:peptidoglycan/LPS O-acetylase OafA/YrhL